MFTILRQNTYTKETKELSCETVISENGTSLNVSENGVCSGLGRNVF